MSRHRGAIVAVDQGKSGTRAVAFDPTGRAVLAEAVTAGFDYGSLREVNDELVHSLVQAVGALCLRMPLDVIGIATTGAPESMVVAVCCVQAIARKTGAGRVLLAEDVVGAHLGALGGHPGVVISAGTGAIALWTDGLVSRRVDGFGPLLGDAGSGYDIGSRGLRAAFAASDGRGPGTLLFDAAHDHLGGVGLEIARRVHARRDTIALLSDFAPAVSAAGEEGDDVALGILDQAGRKLARTARSAVGALGDDHAIEPASYTGRVFRSQRVLDSFREQAVKMGLGVVPPMGDSLAGAAQLACSPDRHPFTALVADTRAG